jgi:hypothetical protein
MKTNLTSEQAAHVLTNPEIGKSATVSGPTDGVFDASDRVEGGNAIVWFNDIEKDKRCVEIAFHLSRSLKSPLQVCTVANQPDYGVCHI